MSLRGSPQLGNRARATGGRFGNASARNGALSCFQVVTSNWQSCECSYICTLVQWDSLPKSVISPAEKVFFAGPKGLP